jgi:outer membrane protein assembly factor BamA
VDFTRKYYVVQPEQVFYYPLIQNRLTWATRITLGVAGPRRDISYFLPNKRLYGGGANSVRGIGRNKLGPLDEQGLPIGGVAKAEASVELRFPVVWRIFGALFGDTGQVWSRYADVSPGDLRYAAGPGLGMDSLIGPVRVDLGFLLGHRRPRESRMLVNLSIGNAF